MGHSYADPARIILISCIILIIYATDVHAFRKDAASSLPLTQSNFSASQIQTQTKIYYEDRNCTFRPTKASKKSLNAILSDAHDIIYIHVELDDTRYERRMKDNSAKDIILPMDWQLATGTRGRTLLRFPYMFKSMSLWTLSPTVFKTTLRFENINQSCPSVFEDDIDLHLYLRESLISLVNQSLTVHNLKDSSYLCQETFETIDDAHAYTVHVPVSFGNIFAILYDMSAHTCNSVNVPRENSTFVHVLTNSQWLQRSTFFATILLSIFFPMILLLCQRQNPPKMYDSDQYLQTTTDLPVGFRHLICYWTNDTWYGTTIRFIRLIIPLVLICFGLYPEVILLRLFDSTYAQRISALKRLTLKSCIAGGCYSYTYDTFIVIVIATSIPLLLEIIYLVVGYMIRNENVLVVIDEMCSESKYEQKHLIPLFKLPKGNRIPRHSDTFSDGLSTFMYYTKARMCLMLKFLTWKQLFEGLKQITSTTAVQVPRWCRPIIWVLLLPLILIYILFVIIFNMLPGGYLIYRLSKTIHLTKRKASRVLLFTYNIFISVILLYRLYYFIYLCALAIVLVFTGIIVNSMIVNPYCIFVLTLTGFVINSVVGIYDKYHKLVNEIIKQGTLHSQSLDHSAAIPIPPALVHRLEDDIHQSIKVDLFWFVVEKCKPLRVQVALLLLQIIIALAAVIIAILVLAEIQELAQFSGVSVTFTTLIASYLIPQVVKKIKSKSARQQKKEILHDRIHLAMLEYRKCEAGVAINDDDSSSDSDGETDCLYVDDSDDAPLSPI